MKKSFKQLMLLGVMGLVLAILVACGGDEKFQHQVKRLQAGKHRF